MNIKQQVVTNFGSELARFEADWRSQVERIKARFKEAVEGISFPGTDFTDVPIVRVKPTSLIELLSFMKIEAGFDYDFCADFTASDESPREPRFDIIYNLFSTTRHNRIRVKMGIAESEEAPSIRSLWAGADWSEREIWDMFGVRFEGRPNIRRILMDNRWKGHPLRKDYSIYSYQIFPNPEPPYPEYLEDE